MHMLSNCEVCFDRQLPNIGCMVKEAVGIERKLCVLFSKLLPTFEHHSCTRNKRSKYHYRGSKMYLGGTGQEKSLSGAVCRD